VKARSGGRVDFVYYPTEQLAKMAQGFEALSTGICDIWYSFYGLYVGTVPLFNYSQLTFQFINVPHIQAAYEAGVKDILDTDLKKHNQIILAQLNSSGDIGSCFFTNNKQVKAPADLKGLKIRVPSAEMGRLVELCGGAPVSMSSAEYVMALQKGTIDGVCTDLEGGSKQKLQDMITNVSVINMQFPTVYTNMNLTTWNKLPPDLQAIFTEEFGKKIWQALRDMAPQIGAANTKVFLDKNVALYYPTEAELIQWREIAKPLPEMWIATPGVGDTGRKILDIIAKTRPK